MTDLASLLARVKEATGPDYELDRDIGLALGGWRYLPNDHEIAQKYPERRWLIAGDSIFADHPGSLYDESFSESLDAALALCERCLPRCWWGIEREFVYDAGSLRERFVGRICANRDSYLHVMTGATPALALLAALLTAMETQSHE